MGIMEIILILLVALIVIGPKRLPEFARTIGSLIHKGQRLWNKTKDEAIKTYEETTKANPKSDE